MSLNQVSEIPGQDQYYDPVVGRFFAPDPIDPSPIEGYNFNRYWYANNNPYKYTDPDGRLAWFAAVPIVYGIGALLHSDPANAPGLGESTEKTSTAEALADALPPAKVASLIKMGVDVNKQREKIDVKVERGATRNSPSQIKTNSSAQDAQKALERDGYARTESKDGKVVVLSKDEKSYTFYQEAKSTGGPSADVKVDGKTVVKIRFDEKL